MCVCVAELSTPILHSGGQSAVLSVSGSPGSWCFCQSLPPLLLLQCFVTGDQQRSGSVCSFLCVRQGRFLPTLHKHYFISGRYFSPTAPTPSGLLAQFNFQPWYFSPARDNLRWKQFHRLVTHRVIIISIRTPGARAEGRKEELIQPGGEQPLGAGGWGAPSSRFSL